MKPAKCLRADKARPVWLKAQGYSDINHQKAINFSDSIEYLRKRFDAVPLKYRDPRIEAALSEVEAQPPSKQFFIEYMITNLRIGFLGPEVSQDILSDTIRRVTHSKKFGVRTCRNAAAWAAAAGFVTMGWVPIGKRCVTAQGAHKTKKIRRYTATYKIRLLASILRLDPAKFKPEIIPIPDECTHKPTPEKSSDNPKGKQPRGGSEGSPLGMLDRLDQKEETSGAPRGGRLRVEESGPIGPDVSTCPPASPPPPTGEQQTLKTGSAPLRRKRPKKPPLRFGRRNRAGAPATYQAARRQFLHDLWIYLKPETPGALPNAFDLYRIAELQTDPYYPEPLPAALAWFDLLVALYIAPWHDRRRKIARDIVPALVQFAAQWTPPEDPAAFEDWIQGLAPAPGIAVRPSDLGEYFRLWPYVRSTLSLIHAGRLRFDASILENRAGALPAFCRLFFRSGDLTT